MQVLAALLAGAILGCGASPDAPVARVLGREARTGPFVPPHAYEWFARGELAAARGDWSAAVASFEVARTAPEEDPYVLARLADAYDRLGDRHATERVLAEAQELFPDSEAVYLTRARIDARQGRFADAVRAYERAIDLGAGSVEALLELAALLEAHQNATRAQQVLIEFLQRHDMPQSAIAEASLRLAITRRDVAAVRTAAAASLLHAPLRPHELQDAARVALEEGDSVLAGELLAAVPDTERDLELEIRTALAAGNVPRAEALLSSASQEEIGGAATLAQLWLAAGSPDRAAAILDATPESAPSSDRLMLLGEVREAQRHFGAAALAFARVALGTTPYATATDRLADVFAQAGAVHLGAEVRRVRNHADNPATVSSPQTESEP